MKLIVVEDEKDYSNWPFKARSVAAPWCFGS